MTPRDFCYWLQGYFEISGKTKIDDYQVTLIKKHLAMVFATHIDATFGPKETQELLSQLHNSKVDAMPKC